MNPTDDILRLDSVGKVYRSGQDSLVALADVTLGFRRGTFTAIMGPSGSGKSTLLQCGGGLDRPASGTVVLGGRDLTRMSEDALTLLRRDQIGFVFQSFNLLPSLTARQNVSLPLLLAGRKPGRRQVAEALSAVGLADRAEHRPGTLSGGQQQRVAIARALITQPAVLFADEPTGALDAKTSQVILEMLRGLADRSGQTVIMVTHDPLAAAWAHSVVFLRDGRVDCALESPDPTAIASRMTQLETA
jgi:putative ABC transport system ATP-binding protein